MEQIPRLEIFATGTHRGRSWTVADLREIEANFNRFCVGPTPYYEPTVAIGHDDEQDVLAKSGLPAAGVVKRAAVELSSGNPGAAKLIGSLGEIPDQVAQWIRDGKYRRCSAEIYEDFVDDAGKSWGKALRRLALLGSEIPEVMSLGKLPSPEPQAVGQFRDRGRTVLVWRFNDSGSIGGTAVDRQQMLDLVKGSGSPLSQEFLDSLSDEQLSMLIASMAPTPPPDPAVMNDPAAGTLTEEERRRQEEAAAAASAANMSDGTVPAAPVTPANPTVTGLPDMGQPASITLKFQEWNGRAQRIETTIRNAERLAQQRLAQEKRATVTKFCDSLVHRGKLLPVERPHVESRLLRADSQQRIHKFADGKSTGTEFEIQMAELEARPQVVKFGEKMPVAPVAVGADRRKQLLSQSHIGRAALEQQKK